MVDVSLRRLKDEGTRNWKRCKGWRRWCGGQLAIPFHQLHTVNHNGGHIIGAFVDEELVGFSYGFPGFSNGRVYLCSHMLAIHPRYRDQEIGERLKREQRQQAAELGYDLVTWTYDPLQTRNAYLNLHKLRGIGAVQLPHHYGEMDDALNEGLPSDRFLVEWWIDSPHVSHRGASMTVPPVTADRSLLRAETKLSGFPVAHPGREFESDEGVWFVPVPEAFQALKKHDLPLARDWRMKTRDVFGQLLENGYVAADVVRGQEAGVCHYVFVPRRQLKI